MKITPFKFLNNTAKIQAMKLKAAVEKGRVTGLTKRVAELQHLVRDSGMLEERTSPKYKGNEYQNYTIAVNAIADKYNGTSDWGVLQTGNIIDLRAAFIINEGLKIVRNKPDSDKEYKWAHEFIEYNNLDKEVGQSFAVEAEIEGKIALKLAPEKITTKDKDGKIQDDFQISVRYVSWTDKEYNITAAPQDYLKYIKMEWQPKDASKPETLKEEQFVYKKFGGRLNKPNEAAPRVMKCLTEIDNLSKALRDWRGIDHIFSAPILAAECKDREDVKTTKEALAHKNWKLRKMFISTSKLYYAQFDIKGIESLEKEITALAKMISGTTGVPVHFLGFTDILKQVATARNLMELVKSSTVKERETWKAAFEEAITKAMIMYNKKMNAQMSGERTLDPTKIGVEIPFITEEQWLHLVQFYLPAAIAGKISDVALREQVPSLDIEREEKLEKEKEKSAIEELKRDAASLRDELNQKDLLGEEGAPEQT